MGKQGVSAGFGGWDKATNGKSKVRKEMSVGVRRKTRKGEKEGCTVSEIAMRLGGSFG